MEIPNPIPSKLRQTTRPEANQALSSLPSSAFWGYPTTEPRRRQWTIYTRQPERCCPHHELSSTAGSEQVSWVSRVPLWVADPSRRQFDHWMARPSLHESSEDHRQCRFQGPSQHQLPRRETPFAKFHFPCTFRTRQQNDPRSPKDLFHHHPIRRRLNIGHRPLLAL
jgi:hypothetical protein